MEDLPVVRPLRADDVPACERVLRNLPDWFGIAESVVDYVESLAASHGFVATIDGEVAGFVGLKKHNAEASEVYVMAVAREFHRCGVGSDEGGRGVADGADETAAGKTLGPSHPDAGYAKTRAFYLAMGFIPLEETAVVWGEDNPCLIMVKPLISG